MIEKIKFQNVIDILAEKDLPMGIADADFQKVCTILIKGTQVFDYKAWLGDNSIDINDPEVVKTMGLDELQKLLTVHFRIDHFTRGHLLKLANNGYLANLTKRMYELM